MSATTTAICVIVMGTAGGAIRAPLPLAIRYLLGCSQPPGQQVQVPGQAGTTGAAPPGWSIRSSPAHLLVCAVSASIASHGKPER
jgi:hypothetical protein